MDGHGSAHRADCIQLMLSVLTGVILLAVALTGARAQNEPPPAVTIELVPMGDAEPGLLHWLADRCGEIFGIPTRVGMPALLPGELYNPKRKQYNADALAYSLVERLKDGIWRVLGVVNEDIYAEGMAFVFGSANPGLGVGVVSLVRLKDSFYGLPHNPLRFQTRALKESVRYIGLSMGMRPLDIPQCIMHPSRSVEDIDRKALGLCPPSRDHLEKVLSALRRMPQ